MLIRESGNLWLEDKDHRIPYHIGRMTITEFSFEAQVAAYYARKAGNVVFYYNRYDRWYGMRPVLTGDLDELQGRIIRVHV